MRVFESPDGMRWGIEVKVPSFSSAMITFRRTDASARGDRYAWYNSHMPEASDPRARLTPGQVLDDLSDRDIARLYRRSMPVHTQWPGFFSRAGE